MAKKLVTFYSLLRAGAQEEQYDYPNRGERPMLCGRQTNEAPLKYLLQTYCRAGEGVTVIALCTPEVYVPVSAELGDTVSYVRAALESYCADRGIAPLRVDEVKIRALEENLEEALGQVLERIDPGDEIYIDATGGPRDANFMNILLLQTLTHKGCRVGEMVYSFFGAEKKVRSLNEVTRVMNVTNAMAEFSTYGRTRLLEQAFPESADLAPEIRELKVAITRFSQKVELCDYGADGKKLERCLKDIQEKLDRCARADLNAPLLKQMLPVFREKLSVGADLPMLPTIVRWCAENHLIQQGLTIYSEKIMDFWEENDLLKFGKEEPSGKAKDNRLPKNLLERTMEAAPQNMRKIMYIDRKGKMDDYRRDLPCRVAEVLELWNNPGDKSRVFAGDKAVVDVLNCLFRKNGVRRDKRETFVWITEERKRNEMLPLLRERELDGMDTPEQVILWLAGERGGVHLNRTMRNKAIIDSMLPVIRNEMDGHPDLESWAQNVSLRDLFMNLLDRELLRQLRNQTSHGGGAMARFKTATCAELFRSIGVNVGWGRDVDLAEVRERLLLAADRLECLYEQKKVLEEFS